MGVGSRVGGQSDRDSAILSNTVRVVEFDIARRPGLIDANYCEDEAIGWEG